MANQFFISHSSISEYILSVVFYLTLATNKKLKKVNVLTWIGLTHAIPLSLKKICGPTKGVPSFKHNGNIFDIMKNKSKDYYWLIISNKTQLPNNAHKLKQEFKLSEDDLELVYTPIQWLLNL